MAVVMDAAGEKLHRAHQITSKARAFENKLVRNLVDRENEAYLLTLSLLMGRNAVLIGDAGTAKSEITNRVSRLVEGSTFSIQLSRDTEAHEILGHFDPVKFKKEGKLVRSTQGTLLTANIAILDEVFEANSIVLNALRAPILENKFYDHGVAYDIPLWSVLGSSNLVPEDPRLAALYDRFVLRGFVQPVGDLGKTEELLRASRAIDLEKSGSSDTDAAKERRRRLFFSRISGSNGPETGEYEISVSDFREFRRLSDQLADHVLPITAADGETGEVISAMIETFADLRTVGIEVSDRNKGRAQKAIIAAALLDGKDRAEFGDLRVLRYIVPQRDDQVAEVDAVLRQIIPSQRTTMQEVQVAVDSIKRGLTPGMPLTEDVLENMAEGIETLRELVGIRDYDQQVRSLARRGLDEIEEGLKASDRPEFGSLKQRLNLSDAMRQ